MIEKIFKDIIENKVFSTLIVAVVTWVVKTQYDRYIKIRPRLYLTSGIVLYSQMVRGMMFFDFTWNMDISIKNNSQHTAEQLNFIQIEGYEFSDNPDKLLDKNNHLEKYNFSNISSTMKKEIPYEELANVVYEGDQRVIYPGLKQNEPSEFYKPKGLKELRLILKYKNEKGKSFYTYYTKINGEERNILFSFNPLVLGRFLTLFYR
ncbi:hypothetical protein ACS5PU_21095 [Pedobacter sp. GSP4]|uniref:hypothetical protein n=1 Tax=Pedobacter sp. GSP4 TaxID=3453716 RepID=UPI003EEEDDCF